MRRFITVLCLLAIVGVSACMGFLVGQVAYEPKIITEYVDRPVEVVIEKTIEVPLELREFGSLDELKTWMPSLYIFGGDCDDYSLYLVELAHQDGYEMSTQITGTHMLNSTIIGNDIYFIEPQTGEIWLWGYTD